MKSKEECMFKNRKIGMRLGFGFGVAAFLLAVIAFLSIYRLEAVGHSINLIRRTSR